MALGFEAKLATKRILGIFPRKLNLDVVMNALREILNEDFGIPDLAVQAGLRSPSQSTFTALVFIDVGLMQVSFGGEAVFYFALQKDCLWADSVTTTIFGPGFHVMAINFCESLAEKAGLELTINDETGYFIDRDFNKLKRSFVEWFGLLLQTAMQTHQRSTQNHQEKSEPTDHYLCWAMDKYKPKDSLPGVVAPSGFYRFEQLQKMEQNVPQAADDFFLLLPNACRDALHYRNLAMNKLWCDFRFTTDDADRKLGNEIAEELEIAAKLDPTLPFPKKAYHELCALLERPEIELVNVANDERFPSVGFRKFPICYQFEPWEIAMPGSTPYVFDPSSGFKIEFPGILMEFSPLTFQLKEGGDANASPLSVKDIGSGDAKTIKELQSYDFPKGDGVLQQYDDPNFPLFLTCMLKEQDKKNSRQYHALIINVAAASMEMVDWARTTIVEQIQYAETEDVTAK